MKRLVPTEHPLGLEQRSRTGFDAALLPTRILYHQPIFRQGSGELVNQLLRLLESGQRMEFFFRKSQKGFNIVDRPEDLHHRRHRGSRNRRQPAVRYKLFAVSSSDIHKITADRGERKSDFDGT